MKQVLLLVFLLIFINKIHSQTTLDACILLNAQANTTNNSIELNWPLNNFATQYSLFRKGITTLSWGNAIAVLGANENYYTDFNIEQGVLYEYRVSSAGTVPAFGYILAGSTIPFEESRGTLLLLVDSAFSESLIQEIRILTADIEGDGYDVKRFDVSRNASVVNVKQLIVDQYNASPSQVKTVLLLGHIPVPYSGNINPDGHPEHRGAWPADVYYGEMNGTWTDNSINTTTAAFERNRNISGDGKFDQSNLPSSMELEIGRVDFFDLPSFLASETELMRSYLVKNHAYKMKTYSPIKQALIEDNFGYFSGEAFAASAWRNFSSLVGNSEISSGDFTGDLSTNTYLWAYGCGSGSYNAAAGIATTAQLAGSELNATFSMLFGSYFGDWDNSNNFMRSILAQGKTLSCVWAGRPQWAFHPMSIGKNLGFCTKLTQNNIFTYDPGFGAQSIHIALMGDPTLRNDVLAPITDLNAELTLNVCTLNWSASADTVRGYNVYRKELPNGTFERLNLALITETTYTDSCVSSIGEFAYMVRGVKLITTAAGSYYNSSIGISDTINQEQDFNLVAAATFEYAGNSIQFINSSSNANRYFWTFSNQLTSEELSPIITFGESTFSATLIALNPCTSDTLFIEGEFPVGINKASKEQLLIYPNPAQKIITVELSNSTDFIHRIEMFDVSGRLVKNMQINSTKAEVIIDDLSKGLYLLKCSINNSSSISRILIN